LSPSVSTGGFRTTPTFAAVLVIVSLLAHFVFCGSGLVNTLNQVPCRPPTKGSLLEDVRCVHFFGWPLGTCGDLLTGAFQVVFSIPIPPFLFAVYLFFPLALRLTAVTPCQRESLPPRPDFCCSVSFDLCGSCIPKNAARHFPPGLDRSYTSRPRPNGAHAPPTIP